MKGSTIIKVKFPRDIIIYQNNMGGVYRRDQHIVMGAGFYDVGHLKNV